MFSSPLHPLRSLSIPQCLEYLISGYVKQTFISTTKKIYAVSLNKIISEFVGNIYFAFDVFPTEHRECIQNNGQIIKVVGDKTDYYLDNLDPFCVACSIGYNSGIHDIKIKGINVCDEAIVVITHIKECKNCDHWFSETKGHSIFLYNRVGLCVQPVSYKIGFGGNSQWSNNDIITIHLDFEKMEASFFINDKLQLEPQTLLQNNTYYFAIGIQDTNIEYTLYW